MYLVHLTAIGHPVTSVVPPAPLSFGDTGETLGGLGPRVLIIHL